MHSASSPGRSLLRILRKQGTSIATQLRFLLLPVLAGTALAQMQPVSRYNEESLPILRCTKTSITVLQKDGTRQTADYNRADLRQAEGFGPGRIEIVNVRTDLDALSKLPERKRQDVDAVKAVYEADLTASQNMENCFGLLLYICEGTVGSSLVPIGNLQAGQAEHVRVELHDRANTIAALHVFSQTREIQSNQVSQAYKLDEYISSLSLNTKGIPALDLCQYEREFPAAISDNGDRMAFVRTIDGRKILAVYDLITMKVLSEFVAGEYDEPVYDPRWISETELVYIKKGDLMLLNSSGTKPEKINEQVLRIMQHMPGQHDQLVLFTFRMSAMHTNIELFDVRTRKTLKTDNPDQHEVWIDRLGNGLLGRRFEDRKVTYFYRETVDAKWKPLQSLVKEDKLRFDVGEFDYLDVDTHVVGLSPDGKGVIALARQGGDKLKLVQFDPLSGKVNQVIAQHPKYDLGLTNFQQRMPIYSDEELRCVFFIFDGEKPRTVMLNPQLTPAQQRMDARFPDNTNRLISYSKDLRTFLYVSYSDKAPGTVYVYRPQEGRLIPLLTQGERLKGRPMASSKPMDFTARDGTVLHGYLCLPPGVEAQQLPLVTVIHDGPNERDVWGFYPIEQFLGSRGYAVLRLNYRGSLGYGRAYQDAGYKGRLDEVMIDDVADAVKELIAKGVADPKRIACYGHGLGGWATYMSLIRYPELYKAGCAEAAFTNFGPMVDNSSFTRSSTQNESIEIRSLLTPERYRQQAAMINPINRASELHQPVLILHGEDDRLVHPRDAYAMADAVRKGGGKPTLVIIPKTLHSSWSTEARVSGMNELAAFLSQNL
jgi:dipeptidyl aminopeptidase/acylaminoacyl peptidase